MTLLDYFRHHVGNSVLVHNDATDEETEAEVDRRINDMTNVELLAWIGDYLARSGQ